MVARLMLELKMACLCRFRAASVEVVLKYLAAS